MYWDSLQEERGRGSVRTWVTQRHLDHQKHSHPPPSRIPDWQMYAKPPGSSTKSFLSQNNFLCLIQPQGNFMQLVSFSSFLGALWSPSFLQQEELRFRGNSHTTFHPFLGLLDSFLCNALGAFEEMIMTSGYFPSFMTKHGATMPWQASHRIWGWTAVTNTDGLLWHRP